MSYWDLVDPIWEKVSIYDGGDIFLRQYNASPEASRILFAAHWTQSEVRNGGFNQYFSNSTGVLAPEAVVAFRALGMPQSAAAIEQAMAFFDSPYPRERNERQEALDAAWEASGDEDYEPFTDIDDLFFELLDTENGGFAAAADMYAATNG
ncbi:DUF4375 domain-containing protein [Luteimonas aestuarii]|uniref:DUF4375 domain-containing protein n=1 Tax=Luteimonas aestuarii TaxID=453837 RepID=A0A4R5TP93_9GAMM|nr:DUF4375 domain-containing protein [Luteimonas aestuarii]TDK18456.1 DUF4375 domain-containing protein [Luteimonas aestuarii]